MPSDRKIGVHMYAISPNTPEAVFVGAPREVDVDVVVPVYNEQAELGSSILLLLSHLQKASRTGMPFSWQVVIADNASTDSTWQLACTLVNEHPDSVRAVRIPRKGRGRALKRTWERSCARVLSYMDVDLSTDLASFPALVGPILEGGADVSFGSRLLPGSRVTRSAKREVISRTYNLLLRRYLGVSFRDAQCGFKAISSEAAAVLLPLVEDDEWFFDTELLVKAERLGAAMNEVAVTWREDPGTTVHIVDTALKDLRGMHRLKHEGNTTGKGDRRPMGQRFGRAVMPGE